MLSIVAPRSDGRSIPPRARFGADIAPVRLACGKFPRPARTAEQMSPNGAPAVVRYSQAKCGRWLNYHPPAACQSDYANERRFLWENASFYPRVRRKQFRACRLCGEPYGRVLVRGIDAAEVRCAPPFCRRGAEASVRS